MQREQQAVQHRQQEHELRPGQMRVNIIHPTAEEFILSLAIVDPVSIQAEDRTCSICMKPYTQAGATEPSSNEEIRRLPCTSGHTFGVDCLRKLFRPNRDGFFNCPLCREQLVILPDIPHHSSGRIEDFRYRVETCPNMDSWTLEDLRAEECVDVCLDDGSEDREDTDSEEKIYGCGGVSLGNTRPGEGVDICADYGSCGGGRVSLEDIMAEEGVDICADCGGEDDTDSEEKSICRCRWG